MKSSIRWVLLTGFLALPFLFIIGRTQPVDIRRGGGSGAVNLNLQINSLVVTNTATAGTINANAINGNSGDFGNGIIVRTLTNWSNVVLDGSATRNPGLKLNSLIAGATSRSWGIGLHHDLVGDFVIRESSTNAVDPFTSGTTRLQLRPGGAIYFSGQLVSPTNVIEFALSDEVTPLTTGTAKLTWRAPFALTVKEVRSSLSIAPNSAIVTVDINESGTSILGTKLNIDILEKTSVTASAQVTITDSAVANDSEITFDIDVVGADAAGLKVKIYYTQ